MLCALPNPSPPPPGPRHEIDVGFNRSDINLTERSLTREVTHGS